jgi:hypothetical protein
LAYSDDEHFRLGQVVELLNETLYIISSDARGKQILGYVEDAALPSDLDFIHVYEPLGSQIGKAREAVAGALKRRRFLER